MTPQRRIFTFIVVGGSAAFVHWTGVVLLVHYLHWPPLLANVGGWAIAVGVSFSGQSALTFRGHGAPLRRAAGRYVALSFAGFAVNEAGYAAMLHWSPWRYELSLVIVLAAVAVFTYLASRRWAFRT